MRVLVIYSMRGNYKRRKTIDDSLYCYGKYLDNVYYLNYIPDCDLLNIKKWIENIHFDAVIYHYTFICIRWNNQKLWDMTMKTFKGLFRDSVQILTPQDEYFKTGKIREFIDEIKIDIVLTLAKGKDITTFYPTQHGVRKYITILPGYVDEGMISTVNKFNNSVKKDIDIGYRARKLSYALGQHGLLKTKITNVFKERLKNYPHIIADVENTIEDKNVFYGLDWYRFLLRCRTMPGCLGGASVIDVDGKLNNTVSYFMGKKPKATFEEVVESLPELKGLEGSLQYKAISPRNFEMALTKTCQILIKDNYFIMKPNVHYIELNEDFSNIDEVIVKIQDKKYCESIAENAYRDLIESGKYSYKRFVKKVERLIQRIIEEKGVKPNQESKKSIYLYVALKIYNLVTEMISFIKK